MERRAEQRQADLNSQPLLRASEEHFDVTAASHVAGSARQTYYRWMDSNSRVSRRFQPHIRRVKPEERLKDIAEHALVARIEEGSDVLIKFALERKAKDRGHGSEAMTPEQETRLDDIAERWGSLSPTMDINCRPRKSGPFG